MLGRRGSGHGGLVYLAGGCRGDAEFGSDCVDRLLGDVEIYQTVSGKVGADVALVVPMNFLAGQPV